MTSKSNTTKFNIDDIVRVTLDVEVNRLYKVLNRSKKNVNLILLEEISKDHNKYYIQDIYLILDKIYQRKQKILKLKLNLENYEQSRN